MLTDEEARNFEDKLELALRSLHPGAGHVCAIPSTEVKDTWHVVVEYSATISLNDFKGLAPEEAVALIEKLIPIKAPGCKEVCAGMNTQSERNPKPSRTAVLTVLFHDLPSWAIAGDADDLCVMYESYKSALVREGSRFIELRGGHVDNDSQYPPTTGLIVPVGQIKSLAYRDSGMTQAQHLRATAEEMAESEPLEVREKVAELLKAVDY